MSIEKYTSLIRLEQRFTLKKDYGLNPEEHPGYKESGEVKKDNVM